MTPVEEMKLMADDAANKRARWFLVLGIVCIAMTLRVPITTIGPIVGLIKEDLSLSNTLAGFITTLPLLAFALFSPLAPKLSARFGIERVLFISLICITIGIILRSTSGIITLYIGTAIIGLAISVGNVLVPGLIKRDFPLKVGVVTGIFSISMNAASAVGSALSVPIAIDLQLGWKWALGVWALVSLIALLIWLPQIRRKQIQKRTENATAAQVQLKVNLWKSKLAWQVTFVMGLQSTIYYIIIAWYAEILIEQGFTNNQAGWLLTIILVASLPFYFILPIIAERQEQQRSLVVIIVALYLIGIFGTLYAPASLQFLWSIALGIAIGSVFSLALTFFSLRTSNAREAAELSGMAQSVGFLLAAIGPTLFGFIYDVTHDWTLPLYILAFLSLLILLFGLGAGKNEVVSSK